MLKDNEGNKITIYKPENFHVKVIGRSGCGKTYWCCRYIQETAKNVPTLVLDFSGSYTNRELKKNGFTDEQFQTINLRKEGIALMVCKEQAVDMVVDSIITLLNISSLYQKKILREACEKTFEFNGFFSFARLYGELVALREIDEDRDIVKNADILLNRLDHLKGIESLRIMPGSSVSLSKNCIIELTEFATRIRIDLAQFLLEILWREIQNKIVERMQIVLDEFHLLSLKGTAVENMLREGRKFGLGLILLTQYVEPDAAHTLEQSATSLYFLPDVHNFQVVAQMIDPSEYKKWIPKLKDLKQGQCILDAAFAVNGKGAVYGQPILCNVEK